MNDNRARFGSLRRSNNPFDAIAARYDAWFDSNEGRVIFQQEVACLRRVMPPEAGRWLEVGVGTGRLASALGITEGIDPSDAMLTLARQRGVRAINAVGERLPYADRTFDGVLMTTTLCFLADPIQSLTECHRVLKDTGRLVVGLIPADGLWGRLYMQKAAEGHPVYAAASFRTAASVIDLAVSVGFGLVEACSWLLPPPASAEAVAQLHDGIVPDAGFAAMAFAPSGSLQRPPSGGHGDAPERHPG